MFVNNLGRRRKQLSCVAACCSDPPHSHSPPLEPFHIYVVDVCRTPQPLSQPALLSLWGFPPTRTESRWPASAAARVCSASDTVHVSGRPFRNPLRLHFVSGFPPTDPYHSYSLIISFRLFPHLYFFFILDLSSILLAALWIEFGFICFVSNQLSSAVLLRLVIVTTDRSCLRSRSLGGSNIVSGWWHRAWIFNTAPSPQYAWLYLSAYVHIYVCCCGWRKQFTARQGTCRSGLFFVINPRQTRTCYVDVHFICLGLSLLGAAGWIWTDISMSLCVGGYKIYCGSC